LHLQDNVKITSLTKRRKTIPILESFTLHIACLHDQNKSGLFEGPVFIQPIRTKSFQKALIGWKKAGPPKKPLLF